MRIAIVGLGYVGIQLAVALGRKHQVVGLDLDEQKITDYQANYDATGEVSEAKLRAATHLEFTTQRGHVSDLTPSPDQLLVFYLPGNADWQMAVEKIESLLGHLRTHL